MAKVLENFDFAGHRRYPWEEWSDCRIWSIAKGEDFNCAIESMRALLYMRAREMQMKVRVSTDESGEELIFQFYNPNEGQKIP